MKLANATTATLEEAAFVCSVPILEDGEGPRWKFNYQGERVHDPHPDILLLGAYRHPETGNNLVGGINLHYLDTRSRDSLAKALPKIMSARNLHDRYNRGRALAPDVFDHFYRTYDARYIRGVEPDIMYPKYGYIQAAKKWLKNKFAKTKQQRIKDTEPEFPQDLDNIQDRLKQVVTQLQKQPPPEEPPDSPEMQAARDAYRQFKRTPRDVQHRENMPMRQAEQDIEQDAELRPEPKQTPRQAQKELQQDRIKTRQELSNPENEINLDEPPEEPEPIDLEESICYYSPVKGCWVIEPPTCIPSYQ